MALLASIDSSTSGPSPTLVLKEEANSINYLSLFASINETDNKPICEPAYKVNFKHTLFLPLCVSTFYCQDKWYPIEATDA